MGQGMEGMEVGWCDRVPIEHGKGVVVGGAQVLPAYHAGDVSDNCPGWSSVVKGVLEGVTVVGLPVQVSSTRHDRSGEGTEGGAGVVWWVQDGGGSGSIGADFLEVEDGGWGLWARVVGGGSLAAGDAVGSSGGHCSMDRLSGWGLVVRFGLALCLCMASAQRWWGWWCDWVVW